MMWHDACCDPGSPGPTQRNQWNMRESFRVSSFHLQHPQEQGMPSPQLAWWQQERQSTILIQLAVPMCLRTSARNLSMAMFLQPNLWCSLIILESKGVAFSHLEIPQIKYSIIFGQSPDFATSTFIAWRLCYLSPHDRPSSCTGSSEKSRLKPCKT